MANFLNKIKFKWLSPLFLAFCFFYIGASQTTASKNDFKSRSYVSSNNQSATSFFSALSDFEIEEDDVSSEFGLIFHSIVFLKQKNKSILYTLSPSLSFFPFKGLSLHILNGSIRI